MIGIIVGDIAMSRFLLPPRRLNSVFLRIIELTKQNWIVSKYIWMPSYGCESPGWVKISNSLCGRVNFFSDPSPHGWICQCPPLVYCVRARCPGAIKHCGISLWFWNGTSSSHYLVLVLVFALLFLHGLPSCSSPGGWRQLDLMTCWPLLATIGALSASPKFSNKMWP